MSARVLLPGELPRLLKHVQPNNQVHARVYKIEEKIGSRNHYWILHMKVHEAGYYADLLSFDVPMYDGTPYGKWNAHYTDLVAAVGRDKAGNVMEDDVEDMLFLVRVGAQRYESPDRLSVLRLWKARNDGRPSY